MPRSGTPRTAIKEGANNAVTGTLTFAATGLVTVNQSGNTFTFGSATGTVSSSSGSSTDNAIARFDGTSGSIIQNSVVTLSDTGIIAGASIDADTNTITNIENADIKSGAAIARNKLASGTASHVLINDGSGVMSSEATLAVSRGGTNIGSYTAGDLLYATGATTLAQLAIGASGTILISNGSAPTWATLSTAGIAPNDATYLCLTTNSTLTNERAISFNSTNFSIIDLGAGNTYSVNTSQNIDVTASPTFIAPSVQRIIISGSTNQNFINASGTLDNATGNEIAYTLAYTVNKATSGNDTGLLISMTDTSSPGTSLVLDLQVNTVSLLNVDNTGKLTAANLVDSALTAGRVVFAGTAGLLDDDSLFTWDDTNKRHGIGTSTPLYPLDLRGTLTSTSGNDAVHFVTAETSPSGASTAAHRAIDAIITYNTSNTNNLTTLASGRFLAINNNSAGGTLTTLQGLALQCITGPVLGAASGTAYSANITGAVFQAIQNSNTASTVATVYAGQFSADHRGAQTVTSQAAGIFTVSVTNASAISTAAYGNWIRFSTVFGNALTAGTITNIYGLNIEGFPTGAATFTNTPHQILLQAGATANIAIRQQGANNQSRFQGAVTIGADAAPTATYALTLTGNLTTSATVFNFTTLTSLTFQDALARSRLFMDANTTNISTCPVTITPTANIGTGVSLTTTTPAHTNLGAEQYELLIDMSSTKTWAGSLSIPTQRHLYIRAPVLAGPVTTTIDQVATIAVSGVPTIAGGSSINITESVGFLMEAVAIPSNVLTGIGFSISAPTTGGASTVACGRFMGGNVGINSLSPDTWLDVKITSIATNRHNVVCLDTTTRYTGVYFGSTALTTLPGSGVSSFSLFDFGLAPTSSYSQSNAGNQIFFELQNANNYTGTLTANAISMKVNTSGGTTTGAIGVDSLFTTVSGSTGAVTTGRAARIRGTINGTGTVTTYVGADFTYSSANVAVTTTTGHYLRLTDPTKGSSATTTNWDSLLFEDNTMTVGTRKTHIRALGTTQSRHVGQFKFGTDGAPSVMVDINGGLSINSDGVGVSLTADNQVVTVGDRSYIRLSSNNGTATNRTFVLTQSTRDGHVLVLEWVGTNAGELVDDSAQNGGGNHRLNGTWTPTQYDTLTLISNGTDWVELARSAN